MITVVAVVAVVVVPVTVPVVVGLVRVSFRKGVVQWPYAVRGPQLLKLPFCVVDGATECYALVLVP